MVGSDTMLIPRVCSFSMRDASSAFTSESVHAIIFHICMIENDCEAGVIRGRSWMKVDLASMCHMFTG